MRIKCVAVSENTNSFGLRGHIFLEKESGNLYEVASSLPNRMGGVWDISIPFAEWASKNGYEIPSTLSLFSDLDVAGRTKRLKMVDKEFPLVKRRYIVETVDCFRYKGNWEVNDVLARATITLPDDASDAKFSKACRDAAGISGNHARRNDNLFSGLEACWKVGNHTAVIVSAAD